jgi:GNAT superfamily N-acetyltransferase
VRISPCHADDLAALDALWPRHGLADRFARQEAGQSTFLLARDGDDIVERGEVVWTGPVMPDVLASVGAVPEVNGLAVVADRRGEGIGTALLNAIETEARLRGFAAIGLGVGLDNDKAERLYRRLEFRGDLQYDDCYTTHDASGVAHKVADRCRFLTKQL